MDSEINTTTITDRNGRKIELREVDEMSRVVAYHQGQSIGEFLFSLREGGHPE